jgi:hypothetical protein
MVRRVQNRYEWFLERPEGSLRVVKIENINPILKVLEEYFPFNLGHPIIGATISKIR